jgi:hypothetical protein
MSLLLSKATEKDLANLQKIAERDDELIEMRDKYGMLMAVGTSIKALTELKNKEGKPLYKVDSFKRLNYDYVEEIITYDIQLDIYSGKKDLNHKFQDKFDKQESYWLFIAKKWFNISSNLLKGSDVIINKLKY